MPDVIDEEPELGRGSLWLLRACAVFVVLVLVWFLVDAIAG